MNKKLLLTLCILLVFVGGCDKGEEETSGIKIKGFDGVYAILENGERVCIADQTRVYFENKTGYAITDRYGHDIYYELNKKHNYDNRIIFHPETEIEVCRNVSNVDINNLCINQLYNITLPCSYCITILYNQTIKDEGQNCLQDMYKEMLRS